MKMTKYDRFMATTRHPEYLQEYEALRRLRAKDDKKADAYAKKLGNKWGQYPPPRPIIYAACDDKSDWGFPDLYPPPVQKIDIDNSTSFVKEYPPLELKEKKSGKSLHVVYKMADEQMFKKVKRGKTKNNAHFKNIKNRTPFDISPFLPQYSYKKGKYLYLTVDLTKSKKEIMNHFDNIVTLFKKYIPKDKGKNKKTTFNPWIIYDMRHIYSMNFSTISRRLSGLKGNPSHNEELMKYFKSVKRAYNRAYKMIEQAGKEASARRS